MPEPSDEARLAAVQQPNIGPDEMEAVQRGLTLAYPEVRADVIWEVTRNLRGDHAPNCVCARCTVAHEIARDFGGSDA